MDVLDNLRIDLYCQPCATLFWIGALNLVGVFLPLDGIGAIVKRALWSAIMTRKAAIKNSWDCYEYLVSKDINRIHVIFAAIDDIKVNQKNLDERWQHIKPIPYIQRHHHFEPQGNKVIIYALTATFSQYKKVLMIPGRRLSYSNVFSSDSEQEQTIIKY